MQVLTINLFFATIFASFFCKNDKKKLNLHNLEF